MRTTDSGAWGSKFSITARAMAGRSDCGFDYPLYECRQKDIGTEEKTRFRRWRNGFRILTTDKLDVF